MKNYLRSPIENSESSSEDEDEREFRHKKAEVKSKDYSQFFCKISDKKFLKKFIFLQILGKLKF